MMLGSDDNTYIQANDLRIRAFEGTITMTVDNTNNRVGIGVTGPAVPLHLYGSGEIIRIADSVAAGSPYLSFYQQTTRRAYIQSLDTENSLRLAAEYGPIEFMTATDGSETEKMRITTGGDVGIGITNPVATLHVNGNMR
jgi:hypothetical protein